MVDFELARLVAELALEERLLVGTKGFDEGLESVEALLGNGDGFLRQDKLLAQVNRVGRRCGNQGIEGRGRDGERIGGGGFGCNRVFHVPIIARTNVQSQYLKQRFLLPYNAFKGSIVGMI